jgi:histidinol-phosphate aminotransferase
MGRGEDGRTERADPTNGGDGGRGAPPRFHDTAAPAGERPRGNAGGATGAQGTGARARAALAAIAAYAPADDATPCAIDLSENTNLWGMPPAAERALRDSPLAARASQYPSLYGAALAREAAAYFGVEPGAIAVGTGSDDVLDALFRAWGEPGAHVVFPAPTFSMVPVFARLNALEPVPVPLTETYEADVDALVAARGAVTYLCSPNNPTGTTLERATIERVAREASGIVVVDEAYAEFAGADVLDLVARHPRLVVTRTMSKAFGMAGLRVGFGIASPEVAAEIRKALGPYAVNVVAERAAIAALREDVAWVRERAAEAVAVRERLAAALRALGLEPLPSRANFLFVPVRDARGIAARMRARGVAVRAFAGLPAVSEALRVTEGSALRIGAGPWPAVEGAVEALRLALEEER